MSDLQTIYKKSLHSGTAGASAMAIQVSSLMWLRTTMNYQYKNGGTFPAAFSQIYKQGGLVRFYRGYIPALMIGPISRFGDTAMNEASLVIFKKYYPDTPIFLQTAGASVMAGIWRLGTVPIDTWKTSKQVHGKDGLKIVMDKVRANGVPALYQGALASSFATMVGHYPWFVTYNYMNSYLPNISYKEDALKALGRNALIGFCASAISDTTSNSIRVIKTVKQTNAIQIGYMEALQQVVKKDGWRGLMFRGLETKLLTNGVQGIIFSVVWKFLKDY